MTLPWHLAALVGTAEHVAGAPVPHEVRGDGEGATVIFHAEAADAVLARRLHVALATACDDAGVPHRFLVVRTEPPTFRKGGEDMPDGWPPGVGRP